MIDLPHPVRHILALAALVLLSSCTAAYWDPTIGVSSDEGHVVRSPTPSPQDAAIEFPTPDEPQDKEPSRQELYPGTGTFVKFRKDGQPAPAGEGDITLNFDNTDIQEVAKVILGDLLGVNYILDPAVKGAVTMQTGRPLTRDLLLPTLETLLRMHQAALVESAGSYRVVPMGTALHGALVPQLGESSKPLPRGYSLRIAPLKFIGAAEMAKILQPLAPEGSIIRVDTVRNLLVLSGTSPELGSLLDTIAVFDVDWMKGLSVGLFRLEYSKITDVAEQLGALFGKEESPLTGLFRVIPVETANSLLVITHQERYLDEIGAWIRRLDQAGDEGDASERLYVYRVKHGDAGNLANILSQLFSDQPGTQKAAPSIAPGLRSTTLRSQPKATTGSEKALETPAASPMSATTGGTTPAATGYKLDSGVSIVADAVNNSLLVRATPAEYRKIANALDKLDILPLQVLVEATIVEVSLSGNLKYGLQWFFKTSHGDKTGNWKLDGNIDGATSGLSSLFPGFNWSLVKAADDVRAVLSAFAGDGLVNVLSSPSVMVLDNRMAKIQVGDQVPIVNSQQQGTSTTDRVVNSIEYRDTGVMLAVTPRVTPGGLVIMDIEQEVSDVSDVKKSEVDSPTISTRNISSSVAVKNDQVVVLGGLIRDKRSNNEGGVPGLYKAPVLGWLFGQTEKSSERTELVVMLTPKVIRTEQDIEAVTRDYRRKLKGLEEKF